MSIGETMIDRCQYCGEMEHLTIDDNMSINTCDAIRFNTRFGDWDNADCLRCLECHPNHLKTEPEDKIKSRFELLDL